MKPPHQPDSGEAIQIPKRSLKPRILAEFDPIYLSDRFPWLMERVKLQRLPSPQPADGLYGKCGRWIFHECRTRQTMRDDVATLLEMSNPLRISSATRYRPLAEVQAMTGPIPKQIP